MVSRTTELINETGKYLGHILFETTYEIQKKLILGTLPHANQRQTLMETSVYKYENREIVFKPNNAYCHDYIFQTWLYLPDIFDRNMRINNNQSYLYTSWKFRKKLIHKNKQSIVKQNKSAIRIPTTY